jgi:hypothetical protein
MRISQKPLSTCRSAAMLALIGLAVAVAPAQAIVEHAYSGQSFGPGGLGTSGFSRVGSVAVDQSTEDVYVFDGGTNSLYKFDAAGEPVNFSALGSNVINGAFSTKSGNMQIAVDSSSGPTAGEIYVSESEGPEVLIYGPDGKRLGSLPAGGAACGVAVDQSGNVYVDKVLPKTINEYSPSGSVAKGGDLTRSLESTDPGFHCNVAVDGDGSSIYSARPTGEIAKYEASQFGSPNPIATLLDPLGNTLAVDPFDGEVYVHEGGAIAVYGPSGEPPALYKFGQTGPGQLSGSEIAEGVAVNATSGHGASGNVYAGNGGEVNIYKPVLLPDAETEPALNVAKNEAVLRGIVNPDGTSVTECEFEYGTSESFGESAPCSQALPLTGNSPIPVSATVSGLQANTTYFYRVSPGNAAGVNNAQGSPQSFTTPTAVDGVSTLAASAITRTSATLSGALSPDGVDAHYYFEYGTGETPASTFLCSFEPECQTSPAPPGTDAGTANASVAATTGLTGLTAGAVYHYRLVAVNAEGTTFGADRTFTTLPAVRNVATEAAAGVSVSSATLHGSLAPENGSVTYFFEYGTEAGVYGSQTAELTSPSSGAESAPVEAVVSGLQPNTTYHFRLVASNSFGTTHGADRQFTSGAAAPLNDQPLSAAGITRTSVVVSGGVIDPENSATSYHYVYISEAGYRAALAEAGSNPEAASNPYAGGSLTATVEIGSGNTPQQLPSTPIGGLLPETIYHYALVASSAQGTTRGPDGTFTTGARTPPQVATGPAAGVTQNGAVIGATVRTEGLATTYGFELAVSGGAYGPPTGLGSVSLGASEQSVSLSLAGLLPGTTYVYRVEASSIDGTSYGAPQQFTTPVFATPFATPPATLPFLAVPSVAFPAEGKDTSSVPAAKKCAKGKTLKKGKCLKRKAKKKKKKKAKKSQTRSRAATAHSARTFSLSETGHLRLTSHHGFTLNEKGSASGTIAGTIYLHLNVVSTNKVTAEVNIYPSGGSLTGSASASYHPAGAVATFNGTMAIVRGTGRYSHARGSGLSFTGTVTRSNDAVTVHVNGQMSA